MKMSRRGMGPRALAALGLLTLVCGAARAGAPATVLVVDIVPKD